jgi:hypothetical protein
LSDTSATITGSAEAASACAMASSAPGSGCWKSASVSTIRVATSSATRRASVGVVVGGDQHRTADHRHVGVRKSMGEVAVEHTGVLLPREAALVDALGGPGEGGRGRDRQRQADQVPRGLDLALQDARRHLDDLGAAIVAVDVRVGVAVERRGAVLEHRFGGVAMQVERHQHWDRRPDPRPQFGQEGAFDVLDAFGRAGAVQRQADRIDRSGLVQPREQGVANGLVGFGGDGGRRLRDRGQGGRQFDAQPARQRRSCRPDRHARRGGASRCRRPRSRMRT